VQKCFCTQIYSFQLIGLTPSSIVKIFRTISLEVLVGPSLANISLLRLLLLINCVSMSKLSGCLNSKIGFCIHLGFGPVFGVVRQVANYYVVRASMTFDGLEAFWDLGCSFLYLCLWILIRLHPKAAKTKKLSTSAVAKNSSNITKKQQQQTNSSSFLAASNDGYLLSCAASVIARCCLLVYPWVPLPELGRVVIFGLTLPSLIIWDLRAKITTTCQRFFRSRKLAIVTRPLSSYEPTCTMMTSLIGTCDELRPTFTQSRYVQQPSS
jgi:hypothetical protein